jgi:hypothetical protein
MNRVTVDIGPSQTNAPITNAAHKRKAPESEGNGQGDAKRTQPSRRAKKVATPQNVAGLTPTPGLASATLSKAPQQQSQPLPFPAGFPPVSSDIRAALCDTLPYWKVHQGGIQSKHNVASGMLLNGKTTSRDVVQSQVVITTV